MKSEGQQQPQQREHHNLDGQFATVIQMDIVEDDSIFVATSKDLHGLVVTAHNLGAMLKGLPGAVEKHYLAKGVRVIAARAQADLPGHTAVVVAMPVEFAEKALRRVAELV